jgi:hypothetical protein
MKTFNFGKIIKSEKGSSILESMIAILLLCLIFFGIMQVFSFAMGNMICRYSAFNGARALSLGYTPRITEKTVRLSAMGISGKDRSSPKLKTLPKTDLLKKMQMYMMTGNANVDFEYWQNQHIIDAGAPRLRYGFGDLNREVVDIYVSLDNCPLLTDGIGQLLNMKLKDANLRANYNFYNHSYKFLKN